MFLKGKIQLLLNVGKLHVEKCVRMYLYQVSKASLLLTGLSDMKP